MFVQLDCRDDPPRQPIPDLGWWPGTDDRRVAVVLDLAGTKAIDLAVALAIERGFRPVPVINASPGPQGAWDHCVVDMRALMGALFGGSPPLAACDIPADAPPVFILDSVRSYGERPTEPEVFDNRWMVFPQDFPSAAFLREHGIEEVLVIQEQVLEPQEDLRDVLSRWRKGGLKILSTALVNPRVVKPAELKPRSRIDEFWRRAVQQLRLGRSSAGGFGSYWPGDSSAG